MGQRRGASTPIRRGGPVRLNFSDTGIQNDLSQFRKDLGQFQTDLRGMAQRNAGILKRKQPSSTGSDLMKF